MPRGGKRVGAGRKPGLPAKKIRERQQQVQAILADDITPFQVMIENMRHWRKLAISSEAALAQMSHKDVKGMKPEDAFDYILNEVKRVAGFRDRAEECAQHAAPYCHPKISTVTHQGDQDNPISHIHKIEFEIVHSPNAGR
jgi:hypothetical protein